MIDFNKSILENRKLKKSPFLAAHRGVCGANIPCNTMVSFKIAIEQGADVVELDVSKTKDGKFFVFHPGMESVFLQSEKRIRDLTAAEVESMYLYNQDRVITSYKVPTLQEALTYLKGKVYINVDKFWEDVEGISAEIRMAGVEKQVIVKTYTDENSLNAVRKYAPDFMFMPMVRRRDEVTEWLLTQGVNIIGTEILFETENDQVATDEYINMMHEKGLMIWANAIVYNEKDVISAHRTDDRSLADSPENGWGWLIDKQVDFIQTDWLAALNAYIKSR